MKKVLICGGGFHAVKIAELAAEQGVEILKKPTPNALPIDIMYEINNIKPIAQKLIIESQKPNRAERRKRNNKKRKK